MHDEIQSLFNYNPPSLEIDSGGPAPVPPTPLSFYDKHIDKRLLLKRLYIIPSLRQSLADAVDKKLVALENDAVLPSKESGEFVSQSRRNAATKFAHQGETFYDVDSLVAFYRHTTSTSCKPLASLLAIYPCVSSSWFSLFRWSRNHGMETTAHPYVMEDVALRLVDTCADDSKLPDCLDQNTKMLLRETSKRYPELATWQIIQLSVANEEVIKAMDKVAPNSIFPFKTCLTTGHPSRPDIPVPLDAPKIPWTVPLEKVDTPWINTRSQDAAIANTLMQTPSTTLVTPRKPIKSTKAKSSVRVAQELIQHAWAQCTVKNTTLVVFHCGNLERIGVRDRKNQSLYLTDVIDIHACRDPGYGKLHVALYMIALEDALDRVKQQLEDETQRAKVSVDAEGLKRKRAKTGYSRRRAKGKKNKARKDADEEKLENKNDIQTFDDEASSRALMLLYLSYSTYNSPSPASFLRLTVSPAVFSDFIVKKHAPQIKKTPYSLNGCISLVASSYIASGATGIVHDATLEIRREKGPPLIRNVVVKLSFTSEQRKRLEHEYSIYLRLLDIDAPGILRAFGLFEDVEGEALALILEHGGTSLWHREEVRTNRVTVSESEQEAFVACLDGIHKANVVHNDIRPPNLLVNKDGKVFIADFDKAELNEDEQVFARERRKLNALLHGGYTSD